MIARASRVDDHPVLARSAARLRQGRSAAAAGSGPDLGEVEQPLGVRLCVAHPAAELGQPGADQDDRSRALWPSMEGRDQRSQLLLRARTGAPSTNIASAVPAARAAAASRLEQRLEVVAAKNAPPPTPIPTPSESKVFTLLNIMIALAVLIVIAVVVRIVTRGKPEEPPSTSSRIR